MEPLNTIAVFAGLTWLLAVPLALLFWTPVVAYLGRAWLQLKEREIELRRVALALDVDVPD